MILERRKQHRHHAPPSHIAPSLYPDGCTRTLAVESSLLCVSMCSRKNKLPWNQGQKATSRGRRRETPGSPRPSTCASATHPWYFNGAKHDRAIAWRLIPRTARENAVRKLPADDGEQHKTPSDRRSRATHWKAHAPCISRQVAGPIQVPSSPRRNLWLESRKPATRDTSSTVNGRENAEQAQAGGGAERHRALAPAPPRRCLPARPHTMRPSDARSPTAAPWAPP